jgi:hypothetical protein
MGTSYYGQWFVSLVPNEQGYFLMKYKFTKPFTCYLIN